MLRDRGNLEKYKRKIAYHLQTNPNKNNATSHQKKKKKKGSQKASRHHIQSTGGKKKPVILYPYIPVNIIYSKSIFQ